MVDAGLARGKGATDKPKAATPAATPAIPHEVNLAINSVLKHHRRTELTKEPSRLIVYRSPAEKTKPAKTEAVPADSYMGQQLASGAYPHLERMGEYEVGKGGPRRIDGSKQMKAFSLSWSALNDELDDAPPG